MIRFFVMSPGRVNGQSMEPNYIDRDVFIVNRFKYMFRTPKRFDVIQSYAPYDRNEVLIKRIIGLPGDTVSIKRNIIFVTDESGQEVPLDEYYLPEGTITKVQPGVTQDFFVPPGHYFFVGDNRLYSTDSRDYGTVPRHLIIGQVFEF